MANPIWGSTLRGSIERRTLTGVVNGQVISATYRTTGKDVEPGDYYISNWRDPVFGEYVLATREKNDPPASTGGGGGGGGGGWWNPRKIKTDFAPISTSTPAYAGQFLLTDKPIAGRDCLVFTRGLSDLIGALKRPGLAAYEVPWY